MTTIDNPTVAGLLTRIWPDATVYQCEPLGEGRDWQARRVDWSSEDGLPSEQPIVTVRVRQSADTPRLVRQRPAAGPRFLYATWNLDGYDVQIDEFVSGTPASKVDHHLSYIPSLARALRDLHAERPHETAHPYSFTTRWWVKSVATKLDEALDYLDQVDAGGYAAWRLLSHLSDWDFAPVRTSLLHGDLSDANIILDEQEPARVAGLIDWDVAHYGDYLHDLAQWASFHEREEDQIDRTLHLYHELEPGEKLPPSVRRRFDLYYAIICVTKLAHLHQLGYTDLTRGKRRLDDALERLHP